MAVDRDRNGLVIHAAAERTDETPVTAPAQGSINTHFLSLPQFVYLWESGHWKAGWDPVQDSSQLKHALLPVLGSVLPRAKLGSGIGFTCLPLSLSSHQSKGSGFRIREACIGISAPLPTSLVTSHKLFTLYVPPFPHLQHEDKDNELWILRGVNEMRTMKGSERISSTAQVALTLLSQQKFSVSCARIVFRDLSSVSVTTPSHAFRSLPFSSPVFFFPYPPPAPLWILQEVTKDRKRLHM